MTIEESEPILGAHVGYQTDWHNFVFGIEAGFIAFIGDWARIQGYGANVITDSLAKIGPVFTIGPRVGWTMRDDLLIFSTGGYATASIDTAALSLTTNSVIKKADERHDGWFLGGGIEYALDTNLILGIEYQHLEFERKLHSCAGIATCTTFDDRLVDAQADISRARVSFRLGDGYVENH